MRAAKIAFAAAGISTIFVWSQSQRLSHDDVIGMARATVIALVVAAIYLAPSIVAAFRRHPNSAAIFVVNLFAGWTVIGYVAALAWSCTTAR